MTLVQRLEENAAKFPCKVALIYRDTGMDYATLNSVSNRLANYFLEAGLKKGDKVGLMLPRIPELVISFLSVVKAGGTVAPINFELSDKDITGIFDDIMPRFLIVHESFLDLAKRSLRLSSNISVITVGSDKAEFLSLGGILKKGNPDNPSVDIDEDDVIYLNYTSGSTGNSKGALTTHSNIIWNTLASAKALGLEINDVHLCLFAPFAHPHEIIARPIYLGGTIVLVDKIYPKSIAEAISKHRVTCIMGLAPMYEKLLDVLRHNNLDLSSLRVVESGGMFTPPELIERFRDAIGVPIIPVWGSTETTGVALVNRMTDGIPAESIGKPCLSYSAKVVDENGHELLPGQVGELIFKGPGVVKGYHKNGTTREMCFRNEWYYSGDLGRKDERGNFYFIGRKSEMMKVAGLKVYPLEIELVSLQHPDIKEIAVVPVSHKLRGEIPKAVVVPRDGVEPTEKNIVSFWRDHLAHYKIPRIVEIRKSLPKAGGGKVDRNRLRLESV